MEIVLSREPAKQAAEHISRVRGEHAGDLVCLLSGGSALDIIEYVQINDSKPECRTIFMMGDERWSREPEINNSLQLANRFPDHYVTRNLILTVPDEQENLQEFSTRINKNFFERVSELNNLKFLHVLGVGSDGHTAGIFPLPEELFAMTYGRDLNIVPVSIEGLKIDSRASFSPAWMQTKPDEIIAYVVGENKKMILESLVQESKEIFERPAEIIKLHKHATLYTDVSI